MMSVEIGVQHMNGLSSMYGMNGQCGMSIYICTEHGDHSTHAIISYVTSLYSRQFVLNPFAKLSNTHTQRMALLKWHYNFADDPARTKLNCGHYECCLNKLQKRIRWKQGMDMDMDFIYCIPPTNVIAVPQTEQKLKTFVYSYRRQHNYFRIA